MEYPKIETLYERDEATHKVRPGVLKNRSYGLLREWEFTEKVDGTNIRLIWQDGVMQIGGRTNAAQLPAKLVAWLQERTLTPRLQEVFPETSAIIYGEGYGAGIQKGGGYRPDQQLVVFDVLVDGQWWLDWEGVQDVAGKLGLDTVPYLGSMTLQAATELVRAGFPSSIPGSTCPAEGLVGRPAETLFDKRKARLILKLKTRDFAS